MSARCYVCGATEQLSEVAPHNNLCGECLPAADHVVAMSNAHGKSIAECQCGWRSEIAWARRGTVQQVKVRMHWRDVIRRSVDAYDAEFGDGAAFDQSLRALGGAVIAVWAINLVGVAAIVGGGHG